LLVLRCIAQKTSLGALRSWSSSSTAERVVDRSLRLASAGNHFVAEPGVELIRALGELAVPRLVVDGTEDPLFPLPHGQALARLIRSAELLAVDRTGHDLSRSHLGHRDGRPAGPHAW
jgi:pimeloyl-ACP methyl ester carboxylesterase